MKQVIAFAASVAVLSGAVCAQDETTARDGVYVRAGAGLSFVSDWTQDFTYHPDLVILPAPLTGQSVEFDTGYVGVFALGFDYADGIRTELEYKYARTGVDSLHLNSPVAGPIDRGPDNDDIVGHFVMTNFYFDFANSSPLTPFIGGGVGGAFIENESAERDAALALQGRAGVSLAMGGGFSTDLEYVYLRTNELEFGPDSDDFAPGTPILSSDPAITGERYRASSVMVSLRKQF